MKRKWLLIVVAAALCIFFGTQALASEELVARQNSILTTCADPSGDTSSWESVFCIQYMATHPGLWTGGYPLSSCQACIAGCDASDGGYRQCARDCSRACGGLQPLREAVAQGEPARH